MKTIKTLFGVLTVTAAFAMNGRAQTQIFQFTVPITGYMTMSAQDLDANAVSNYSGAFQLNFNSLSETIYLDPVGETLRQVGTLSYTPTASNIQFHETQALGQFPNPLTNEVSGNLTVNLVPNGGNLTFDTGLQTLTWDAAASVYTVNDAVIWTQGLPMSGSYSLVTGGQTNSGSFVFSYTWWYGQLVTFNTLSITGYPSSIQLSGLGYNPPWYTVANFISPGIVADVRSTNGFEMKLSPGIEGTPNGDGESLYWNLGPVLATNLSVIEPSITTQPLSKIVHGNNSTSFSVTASGALPISYQWSLNSTNIVGAISSTLTIPSVTQTNLGTYAVAVTNTFGSTVSSNAILSMYPYIVTPFTGAVTYWGKSATFSIQAWGTGPLSYQWYQNGVSVLNATNQDLTFTSIVATNAGLYSVVVSSVLGSATNPPALVVVEPAGVSLGFSPTLTISGVVGYNYIIQGSTNLADTNSWVTMTNVTLTQPVQIWVDTNVDASSPFNPRKFYQVLPGQ